MDKKDKVNKITNQSYGVDRKLKSDKIKFIVGCVFLVVMIIVGLIAKIVLK